MADFNDVEEGTGMAKTSSGVPKRAIHLLGRFADLQLQIDVLDGKRRRVTRDDIFDEVSGMGTSQGLTITRADFDEAYPHG